MPQINEISWFGVMTYMILLSTIFMVTIFFNFHSSVSKLSVKLLSLFSFSQLV